MAKCLFSLEYLAGFFDGEGCVTISKSAKNHGAKHNRPKYVLYVAASNIDLRPLEGFKEMFGGYIVAVTHERRPNWTPAFKWTAGAAKAAAFLTAIKEKLVVKRQDAEIGLAFQRLIEGSINKRGFNRYQGLTDAEVAEREALRLRLVVRHGHGTRAAVGG